MVTYANTKKKTNDWYKVCLLKEIFLVILKYMKRLLQSFVYHSGEIKSPRLKSP